MRKSTQDPIATVAGHQPTVWLIASLLTLFREARLNVCVSSLVVARRAELAQVVLSSARQHARYYSITSKQLDPIVWQLISPCAIDWRSRATSPENECGVDGSGGDKEVEEVEVRTGGVGNFARTGYLLA